MSDDTRPPSPPRPSSCTPAGRRTSADQPLNAPITMASTYVAGGDLEYGRYAQPDLDGVRGGARRPGGRPRAGLLLGAGGRRHGARPRRPGRAGGRAAARLPRQRRPARRPRGARPAQGRCSSTSPTPTRWSRPATTRRILWIESPTNPALEVADIATPRRGRPRGRRAGRRRQHLRHAPAPAAARARRRHRAALGDQVPRRPQRRGDGRAGGPRRRSCTTSSRAAATWSARSPGRWRPGSRCAACAPCTCGSSASQANAVELAPAARGAPRRRGGALPGLRRDRRGRAPDAPRPPTCSPTPRRCGCTPPRSAASSRRSSAAGAGRREAATIPEGLVRMSVGIEDVDDLWADLEQALARLP